MIGGIGTPLRQRFGNLGSGPIEGKNVDRTGFSTTRRDGLIVLSGLGGPQRGLGLNAILETIEVTEFQTWWYTG